MSNESPDSEGDCSASGRRHGLDWAGPSDFARLAGGVSRVDLQLVWLVDGLEAHSFPAMLVNTNAIKQYDGLKHSDDNYDGWWLAHMMRLSILPTGYISRGRNAPFATCFGSERRSCANGLRMF
ncbi:MAG TPA: hypothetical protein VF701_00005 [Thermoanaerobaculia bacterium]